MLTRSFRSRRFYLACLALLCIALASRWLWRRWTRDVSAHESYYASAAAARRDPAEHPPLTIKGLLDWALAAKVNIEKNIRDYSAVFTKRERSGGELGPVQMMFVKVRQKPFSVYMHFLAPEDSKGKEAIYVEGRNDGKLLGHTTGLTGKVIGTVPLDPNGWIAMEGQRHPITEVGLLHLTERLVEAARRETRRNVCRIRELADAKINGRPCQCVEAMIPFPIPGHPHGAQLARIFIDKQWNLPIRYEQYDWSGEPADQPVLVEQYTYVDLKLNAGFSDADFDPRNPKYSFP
jgi:hypothetical protein